MKEVLIEKIGELKKIAFELNEFLYENPETGNQEFAACEKICEVLSHWDFKIQKGYLGIPTAFKAIYGCGKPSIAYLCEYDALPEIGHGCGHNMISAISVTAAIALREIIDTIGGQVAVFGCPAEETNGAKVAMAEKGAFNDIDVALMVHPSDVTRESGTSLAMEALQFEYLGKAAHAADNPEDGINALDGVLLLFNSINALRQHVKPDVRIHGIIKEGGIAANIIPERAVAQFYVRSESSSYLKEVVKKVKDCARGAAISTGCTLNISNYELSYDNMITNNTLQEVFNKNLQSTGVNDIQPPKKPSGSSDIGNVSHVVPAIHPYIGIVQGHIPSHTREFALATQTDYAKEMLLKAATALALTGFDIITDKSLLDRIKKEFAESIKVK
ncbi:M20 family metallopeptidase [Caldanaerobius polysaccharolyticus]|uniref:M20 family metallopeptidase n=1 Tax=Caldanaerobius polysaccharolyticus TaxID=44256 RepID=UPI00047940A4|nr:M20 family metallopeptidase [Caldanaerobius polysaccharolyticus]